jgi:hypothetical protein
MPTWPVEPVIGQEYTNGCGSTWVWNGYAWAAKNDDGCCPQEVTVTLTPTDIISISHDRFLFPENGYQVLPPPGPGKYYEISGEGILANYISNSYEGYVAKPFNELRTLDLYYHSQGHAWLINNQKITGIQLFSDPYSTWTDRMNFPRTGELLHEINGQDSLKVDGKISTVVYQPLTVNATPSGFSQTVIINSGIYLGTNGLVEKAKTTTDGTIKIKFYYRVVDANTFLDPKAPGSTVTTNLSITMNAIGGGIWVLGNITVPGNVTSLINTSTRIKFTYDLTFDPNAYWSGFPASVTFNGTNTVISPDYVGFIPVGDAIQTPQTLQLDISNPLPPFIHPHADFYKDHFYMAGLNFLDAYVKIPTFAYWDNYPNADTFYVAGDYATQYRANRDAYLKNLNNHLLSKKVGTSGKTVSSPLPKFEDVGPAPHTLPYIGPYDLFPVYNGPSFSAVGVTAIEKRFMEYVESCKIMDVDLWNASSYVPSYINNLPYPPDPGYYFIQTGLSGPYYSTSNPPDFYNDTLVYNPNSRRISSLTILSPGEGYTTDDLITFNDPTGSQAVGRVTAVGASGQILNVSLVDRSLLGYFPLSYVLGGKDYSTGPTASFYGSGGTGGSIGVNVSMGQWISEDDYLVMSDGGLVTAGDVHLYNRAVRDAYIKALNELILANMPLVLSQVLIPEFHLEKYKI